MNFLKKIWNAVFRRKKPKDSKPNPIVKTIVDSLPGKRIKKEKLLGREKSFERKRLNKTERTIRREKAVKALWRRIKVMTNKDTIETGNKAVDDYLNKLLDEGNVQELHNLYVYTSKYKLVNWDEIISPSENGSPLLEDRQEKNNQALVDAVTDFAKAYGIELKNQNDTMYKLQDIWDDYAPDQEALMKEWDNGL